MHQAAPTMKWHPETGEATTFNHPSEVPAGYVDTHPNNLSEADRKAAVEALNKPAAVVVTPAVPDKSGLCLTRKEIAAELSEGGIQFAKNEPTQALYDKLMAALKEHLTIAEVPFHEDADAKALLALVPPPE